MSRFYGDPDEAEAARQKADDALHRIENDLAVAETEAEAIEQENFSTPEEEAELSARMETVQIEIRSLEEDRADAQQDLSIAIEHWVRTHDLS